VNSSVKIEMHSQDTSKVWTSRDGDKVTFTIDRNQQAGTVDATLTNATSGKVAAQHITGRWNCRG
jgi:S1-C subfamily serine protease